MSLLNKCFLCITKKYDKIDVVYLTPGHDGRGSTRPPPVISVTDDLYRYRCTGHDVTFFVWRLNGMDLGVWNKNLPDHLQLHTANESLTSHHQVSHISITKDCTVYSSVSLECCIYIGQNESDRLCSKTIQHAHSCK